MNKIFTSLFLCIFFLASCSTATSTNEQLNQRRDPIIELKDKIPQNFIPKSYTIVSIGDSLTLGVGDSTKRGGYLPYLKEQLEEEKGIKEAVFYNFGVSGNRTSQILNRLYTKEVKDAISQTDMVIITTGGNDVMKVVKENITKLELEDFEKEKKYFKRDLQSIVETIRALNPNTMIGIIGLYNPFYQYFADIKEMDIIMEDWNETSRSVLQKYEHTFFVDISGAFKETEESLFYTDYFHPNNKGYEIIAEQVFSVLHEQAALEAMSNIKYASGKEEKTYNE